jgi:hypothetical protein
MDNMICLFLCCFHRFYYGNVEKKLISLSLPPSLAYLCVGWVGIYCIEDAL